MPNVNTQEKGHALGKIGHVEAQCSHFQLESGAINLFVIVLSVLNI